MAMGDLINAENELLLQEVLNFFPDMTENSALDLELPDRLAGDLYFNKNFIGLGTMQLAGCLRIDSDTQTALLRELGHPLRGRLMDPQTTEMEDIGEYDLIMDCEIYFPTGAFEVDDALNLLERNGYDVIAGGFGIGGPMSSQRGRIDTSFAAADNTKAMHGVLSGWIVVNGSMTALKFRFVSQEAMIG